MSCLRYSVEFQVRRRAQGAAPSSIWLDHGDLLVMDGLAQSEYVHRTVSGLQGPRVNLTFRWITQHIASCPLTGVTCCVSARLAELGPQGRRTREAKSTLFLVDGPLFVNLGVLPLGACLD